MSRTPTEEEIRLWVQQLRDYRTRREARLRLVEARAIRPLIACLFDSSEPVTWAAIQSLQQLRAQEAVPALIELLARGVLLSDVLTALQAITGQNLGLSLQAWQAYLQQRPAQPAGAAVPPPVASPVRSANHPTPPTPDDVPTQSATRPAPAAPPAAAPAAPPPPVAATPACFSPTPPVQKAPGFVPKASPAPVSPTAALPPQQPRNVHAIVKAAGELLGLEPLLHGTAFQFDVSLAGQRAHRVYVICGRRDQQGDELTLVYSPCGLADPQHYERVLRMNTSIPAGAIGLQDVQGQPTLVMIDVFLASALDPRQLAKCIEHVAQGADRLEAILSTQDKY